MTQLELDVKKKRVMIYFIEATERLLKEEGIKSLSIRRIAAEAGYNSATLYNYFTDLDHLVLFASVRYLRDYVILLSKQIEPAMTAIDKYRTIYRCFNTYAFQEPEIFHNMFFGRYSDSLEMILQIYYKQLFPSELSGLGSQMQDMLCRGTMLKRDAVIMEDLIKEGYVAREKGEFTLSLVIALHQSFIYEIMMRGENLNTQKHADRFMALFDYILDAAK